MKRPTSTWRVLLALGLVGAVATPPLADAVSSHRAAPHRHLANGVAPDHGLWDVGNGVYFSPVTGRVMRIGAAPRRTDAGPKGGAPSARGHRVAGYDVRLAGRRRSAFYVPSPPVHGPGRIDLLAGGLCSGSRGIDATTNPSDVVVDRAGRIFWLDQDPSAHLRPLAYVRELGLDGRVRTLGALGGPITGRNIRDGAAGSLARIVPDDHGGVYFSFPAPVYAFGDTSLDGPQMDDVPTSTVIGHLHADGRSTYVAGTAPSDAASDGPITTATFQDVTAMATDHNGHLFVADGQIGWSDEQTGGAQIDQVTADPATPGPSASTSRAVIRVVNLTNRAARYTDGTRDITVAPHAVGRVAGMQNGSAVANGLAIPAGGAALGYVSGIAVRPDGIVYLLQRDGDNVQVLALNPTARTAQPNGRVVPSGRVAGIGGGPAGYGGDGGPATRAKFDVRLSQDWFFGDLAAGPDGDVLIADTVNNRIRRIDAQGTATTIAGNGRAGYSNGPTATRSAIWFPMGVASAPGHRVVLADWYNGRIRAVSADGRLRTLVGDGAQGWCAHARAGGDHMGNGELLSPHDSVTDSRGRVYVADIDLGVVERITPDGGVTIVAGRQHACRSAPPDFHGIPICPMVQPSGDGGPPARAVLQAPSYLAIDKYDNLYISDGSTVRYVNFTSRVLAPQGVKVRPHTIGTVYVGTAVIERIQVPEFGGSESIPYDELVGLAGLAVDLHGTLYIADRHGNRVFRVSWCGEIRPVAGTGSIPYTQGQGDGGTAVAASLVPAGLALDEQRQLLFIASPDEHRVRVVNVGTRPVDIYSGTLLPGFITTYAGGGPCDQQEPGPQISACSYGDYLKANVAAVNAPYDVAVAPGGRLFISDGMADVVRVVDANGLIGTVAGITPPYFGGDVAVAWYELGGYCGDRGIAYRACLGGATGLSLDSHGNLIVAEMMSGVVRRIHNAVRAPIRPLQYPRPVLGAQWRFTPPLRLDAPTGLHVRDPDIAIAPDGTGYVLARQATPDEDTPAGCALWRYTVSRTARADVAIALPDPDRTSVLPGLDRGIGASCALAVTPEPAGSLVPPVGDSARIAFASSATLRGQPVVGSLSEIGTAITGASRDAGTQFLDSPVGALGASTLVENPRIGVEPGQNTFFLAYCCDGTSANESGIAVARSVGGIQYTPVAPIPFGAGYDAPFLEKQFIGTPVVRGNDVYVPLYDWCRTCADSSYQVFVAHSSDGAASWSIGRPLASYSCGAEVDQPGYGFCEGEHGVPQLAMDRAGTLMLVWDDAHHVYFRTSHDRAATWSPPLVLDRGLWAGGYATVVGGDRGRFGVAFLGTTRRVPGDYSRDAQWSVYLSVTRDGGRQFEQSLASTSGPVFTGALCQYSRCFGGGANEAIIGNFFHAAVNPRDGRVVVAVSAAPGYLGVSGGARVVVIRQCSGPPLVGHAPASVCPRSAPPPPPPIAPPSRATNSADLGLLTCAGQPPVLQQPKPKPPPPRPQHHHPVPRHAPPVVVPAQQPAPALVPVPPAPPAPAPIAVGVNAPVIQPGQAPQPNAQPQGNPQANAQAGLATDEQQEPELATQHAMSRKDDTETEMALAAALMLSTAAGAVAVRRRRASALSLALARDRSGRGRRR